MRATEHSRPLCKEEIEKICEILFTRYKERILSHPVKNLDVFKVLIGTILSQRTKDENTDLAVNALFKHVSSPYDIVELDLKRLVKLIKPVAYYKVKARKIKDLCNVLISKFDGVEPRDREALLSLPGVGFKTADVVLCYGFNEEIIPVDTHVSRISKRLGLIPRNAKKYEEIRERLEVVIPTKFKHIINLAFIQLGKEFCYPKNPKCSNCPILKYCRYGNLQHRSSLSQYLV